MGNEGSNLNNLKIDEDATDVTECWSQFRASANDSCKVFSLHESSYISVFKGERILGPLWTISTPLEKFSNNILKYRHPCIIRYVSSWQQRSIFHLATEYVQPLTQILDELSPFQLCIGLNDILRALVFLHDQAGMSHNNVSMSAIYVTEDGQWKLGGLQYLCTFDELTPAYLKLARLHRYDKSVDPNENSYEITSKVDQYGFAVLVEEVFKGHNNEDVPYLSEFKNYCRETLQHQDPKERAELSEVLEHPFFNHEFISIYKFLNFLPLKTEDEKNTFFNTIIENLRRYNEELVAQQLSGLLLSRMIMLDQTAQNNVVPYVLQPKNDRAQSIEKDGLFSLTVFKKYIKPKIIQLFSVRDKHIRTQLLSHFSKFLHVFTHEELSNHILPELLLGIKDKDDSLVAPTLVCLSELVPILGADTVIGGKRSKIFTDGQPKIKDLSAGKPLKERVLRKSLCDFPCSEEVMEYNSADCSMFDLISTVERPSPVGGESADSAQNNRDILSNQSSDVEWSDWDQKSKLVLSNLETDSLPDKKSDISAKHSISSTSMHNASLKAKQYMVDINELDIKNQKVENSKKSNDLDYFADMMPVIEKANVINVLDKESYVTKEDKFSFVPNEEASEDCWEDGWS